MGTITPNDGCMCISKAIAVLEDIKQEITDLKWDRPPINSPAFGLNDGIDEVVHIINEKIRGLYEGRG